MSMVNDIITFGISNLWTSLLFLWLLRSLFAPMSASRYLPLIFLLVATALTTLINIYSPTIGINMIAYIAVMALLATCYKPRFEAVFIAFYFFFTHLLIEDIVVIAFSLFERVTYNTAMNELNMRIVLMVIVEILFLTCILLVKPKIEIIHEKKKYFSYWSVSFALVAGSLLILHFTTINSIPDEQISISQLVNVAILFCIMHFLLVCLSGIIQFDIIKAENRQLHTISQYYADKVTESIESHQWKHDLKKAFYAIQVMVDKRDIEGIRETAISYSEALDADKVHKANTGIPEIDDITNHLLGRLEDDVEYTFTSTVNEPLKVSSRDCIVLLGNLLDNAVEAVQTVHSEKIIKIKVTIDRNIFHVEVVNSYNGNLLYDGEGHLLTSKAEPSEHGYGLRSVESIVEKYNGTSDFMPVSSNLFSSSVMLFQSRI